MSPNEDARTVSAPTRAYSYELGEVGPVLTREIATETPIEIRFGGRAFAVMMATPADLEDFAVGFALSEGIVERLADIRAVEARLEGDSGRVDVALSGERLSAHLARKRAMSGRTGCGVCGIEDLAHLPVAPRRRAPASAPSPNAIGAALKALELAQPLNARTRSGSRRRLVRTGRDNPLRPRRRRTPQRAGQIDRRAAARGRRPRRRLRADHKSLLVRDGGQGRGLRRRRAGFGIGADVACLAHGCGLRRRPDCDRPRRPCARLH